MRDRFDIDQVIKITGLGIHAEQADGGADFDVACQIAVKKLWKIKEYESLEGQNKLLRLPVAVGDIIWDIDFGRPCGYEVTGFSFGSLNDDDWEEEKVLDKVVVYYTNSNGSITGNFAVSEIGKNVFLTKEEAESALKELERGKGND